MNGGATADQAGLFDSGADGEVSEVCFGDISTIFSAQDDFCHWNHIIWQLNSDGPQLALQPMSSEVSPHQTYKHNAWEMVAYQVQYTQRPEMHFSAGTMGLTR